MNINERLDKVESDVRWNWWCIYAVAFASSLAWLCFWWFSR